MGDKIHVPNAPRNKTLQALLQIEEHQWSAFRKTLAALSHKHLDITQTPSRQRAQVAKVQSKLAARFPTVDLHDRQQLVFLSRYMAREHGERRRRAENERKLALRAAGELGSRADDHNYQERPTEAPKPNTTNDPFLELQHLLRNTGLDWLTKRFAQTGLLTPQTLLQAATDNPSLERLVTQTLTDPIDGDESDGRVLTAFEQGVLAAAIVNYIREKACPVSDAHVRITASALRSSCPRAPTPAHTHNHNHHTNTHSPHTPPNPPEHPPPHLRTPLKIAYLLRNTGLDWLSKRFSHAAPDLPALLRGGPEVVAQTLKNPMEGDESDGRVLTEFEQAVLAVAVQSYVREQRPSGIM